MENTAQELRELLSHNLLGTPYDPSSKHRETFLIDHLVEVVSDWEVGEVDFEEMSQEFKGRDLGNFDLDQWLAEKENEGVYALPPSKT